MVDRIVPASTERTFTDARAALGIDDRLAVETEPYFTVRAHLEREARDRRPSR